MGLDRPRGENFVQIEVKSKLSNKTYLCLVPGEQTLIRNHLEANFQLSSSDEACAILLVHLSELIAETSQDQHLDFLRSWCNSVVIKKGGK